MGKFKVGDMVLVTKHCNFNGDKIDMDAPIGSIQVIEKFSNQLDGYGLQAFSLRGFKRHIYSRLNVEMLAAPALTIESGKFYKTRDGRKVGPMHKWSNGVCHPWEQSGGSNEFDRKGDLWRNDGTSKYTVPTLIAEWVDEPAVAPAKFKVGDLVRSKITGNEHTITDVLFDSAHGKTVYYAAGNGNSGGVFFEEHLTLVTTPAAIVALIDNGQPKPSERPVVHVDQATATAEASRLALKYPGQEFGVFVLADSKIADVVTTQTAVLRAA